MTSRHTILASLPNTMPVPNPSKKYWKLIGKSYYKDIIPSRPKVIYRKPKIFKNIVAPSKFSEKRNTIRNGTNPSVFGQVGNYRCGGPLCATCNFMEHRKKDIKIGMKHHTINQFINCSTSFIIYVITCLCGKPVCGPHHKNPSDQIWRTPEEYHKFQTQTYASPTLQKKTWVCVGRH